MIDVVGVILRYSTVIPALVDPVLLLSFRPDGNNGAGVVLPPQEWGR
jgi:hypothetical protein